MDPLTMWIISLGVFAVAAAGVLKLVEYYQDHKR